MGGRGKKNQKGTERVTSREPYNNTGPNPLSIPNFFSDLDRALGVGHYGGGGQGLSCEVVAVRRGEVPSVDVLGVEDTGDAVGRDP